MNERYNAPDLAALSREQKRELLVQLLQAKAEGIPSSMPLSYGQQALWFMHQLAPESSAYNFICAARVVSDVDRTALRRAFQMLVDRHPMLRTTFTSHGGEPVQQVAVHQDVACEMIDATSWSQEQVEAYLHQEKTRPFDLEHGSVFRVQLLTRGPTDHILLIAAHHIVIDGWSMPILLEELGELYPAARANTPASLPPVRHHYGDYVHWQRDMLAGPEGDRLWAYWQQQLAGDLPVLNLPTDHPRPAVQRYRGASLPFVLPAALTRALYVLAQREGTTMYTIFLAALQILLYRYTGQEDILVGTPAAGRGRTEFARVAGYFVSPMVLRANLTGNPTFQAFLAQIRETVLAALAHQDFPFALLVERLRPHRDPSRSPIFQVVLDWQKQEHFGAHVDSPSVAGTTVRLNLGGLEIESLDLAQQEGQFDLTLDMFEAHGLVFGALRYDTDLFEPPTISRLQGHLQTLLEGIVADPTQHVSTLPLLTDTERHQILVEWNATQGVYPREQCLHHLMEAQVERTPEHVAVTFNESQLTYRAFNQRANQLAHHLRQLGVGPEVLVGICMERSLEMVIGILGILKAGGAYVPLDPTYPQERLAFMLADAQVKVLLTQGHLLPVLPKHAAHVLCLDTDWGTMAQDSVENPVSSATAANPAYVIYTSGSTGVPKGVLISHSNVVRLFTATQAWFQFDASDVWTLFHSYAFDFSVWELWGALLYGGRLVVVPFETSRSPAAFYELLCQERVTVLNQTPSAFRQLMRAQGEKVDAVEKLSLRLIIFGGEALDIQSLRPWFARHGDQRPLLVNMYGITETTVHVTYRPLLLADVQASSDSPIGIPIPDLQVYLLDAHLHPVPIGVPGELYIGGNGLARGYLHRPELTAERFLPNPFSDEMDARLYKTGDQGRYLPNGSIAFLGRIDHQVKIRGFRVELGEVEAVLSQHPGIRETVALVREDIPGDKRLTAYFVPTRGAEPSPGVLRNFLKEKLPDYMVPSAFMRLDAVPLTSNGKVDRQALPAPAQIRLDLEETYVVPRTPLESLIAEIWQEVLHVDRVGVYDNFFDLGGHSLLSVQVIAKLENHIGVRLSLQDIVSQTLGQLAVTCEERMQCDQRTEPVSFTQRVLHALKRTVSHVTGDRP